MNHVRAGLVLLCSLYVLPACDRYPTGSEQPGLPADISNAIPAGDVADLGTPLAGPQSQGTPEAGAPSAPVVEALAGAAARQSAVDPGVVAASGVGSVPDLVWQRPSTGETSIWHGTRWQDGFAPLPRVPVGWEIAGAGDFTGNGSPDLVWQHVGTGDRSIWHMEGRSWTGDFTLLPRVVPAWHIAAVADLTGNGTPDLVWENTSTGDRSVWHMDGASWTGSYTLLPRVAVEWRIASAGDFTGNGHPDLVWENVSTGHRSVWHMDGTSWSGAYTALPRVAVEWRIAGLGDFSGHGNVDLVWQNLSTGQRSIWYMDGATFTGNFLLLETVSTSWRIMGTRLNVASIQPMEPGKAITTGSNHACMLTLAGVAYCWGANSSGQLGTGDTIRSSLPVPVASGLVFEGISAGWETTCAWTSTGAAYCWGGGRGAVGNGSADGSLVPVPVSGDLTFEEIHVGGQWNVCGRTTDGDAHCWGWNNRGRLGTGDTISSNVPVPVVGDLTFASITVGLTHACGLEADGTAHCWGGGAFGSLGTGDTDDQYEPVPVIGDLRFADLKAGATTTCGVDTEGITHSWGQDFHGSLGTGTIPTPRRDEPAPIVGSHTFVTAGAGPQNSLFQIACGIDAGGDAYCWGPNPYGGLGTTATDHTCANGSFACTGTPTAVQGALKFQAISPSNGFTCALTQAGEPYCWGSDLFGKLGSGYTVAGLCAPDGYAASPCSFRPVRVGAPVASPQFAPTLRPGTPRSTGDGDRALELLRR
jgi:alpha-tubulin suppressor-like RCC1 family protein